MTGGQAILLNANKVDYAAGARGHMKSFKGPSYFVSQFEQAWAIEFLTAQPVVDNLSTQVPNRLPPWLLFILSPKMQRPHVCEHITDFDNVWERPVAIFSEAAFKPIP